MMVNFVSTIDSVSEGRIVRFVDKPGGYEIPESPEDIKALVKHSFRAGEPVEITYDDSTRMIVDARPVRR